MIDRGHAYDVLRRVDDILHHCVAVNWREHYPHGICTIYSLLSAPILRCALAEPDLRVVLGTFSGTNHCWIQTGDLILDQTYKQFRTYEPVEWRISDATISDSPYCAYRVLDLDEEDHYRRSIHPSGKTAIKQDFWSNGLHAVRMDGRPG